VDEACEGASPCRGTPPSCSDGDAMFANVDVGVWEVTCGSGGGLICRAFVIVRAAGSGAVHARFTYEMNFEPSEARLTE
jgi:hypothetical protein